MSGTTGTALHRSPNGIVAQTIYETWKDSDGGAWIDAATWQSWANEPLNGTWLYGPFSGFSSEMDARDWFGIGQSPTTGSLVSGDSSTFTNSVGAWTNFGYCALTNPNGRLRMTFTGTAGQVPIADIAVTTVVGQRYRIDLTYATSVNGKNTFVGAGTTAGTSNLASLVMGTGSVGSKTLSFVATGTTTHISVSGSSVWATNDYAEIDNITCTPVNYATSPSGAYYQDNTDGKFKRLWRNRFGNPSNFSGSAWAKTNILSVTTKADGSGDLVVPSTANTTHEVHQAISVVGTVNAITVRAKAGGYSWLVLQIGSNGTCYFDLTNGVLGNGSAGFTATITPVAGMSGYYDCTLYGTANANGNAFIFVSSANGVVTYAGDGVSGLYIAQAQLELGTPTTYEDKSVADQGVTEVFRGNTAKFPRLAAIIAEASNVTIYDLTQPGRPMWMRFASGTNYIINTGTVSSIAACNGLVIIGNSGASSGSAAINFPGDYSTLYRAAGAGSYRGRAISGRNAWYWSLSEPYSAGNIVNTVTNAVAATVLSDAPFDPATGLQVPTIAVMTAGGVSVIYHDGNVYTSSQTEKVTYGYFAGPILIIGNRYAVDGRARFMDMRGITASWTPTYFSAYYYNPSGSGDESAVFPGGVGITAMKAYSTATAASLDLVQVNRAAANASLRASINTYSNTGWMVGDIRRCLLSSNIAESIAAAELVTNGTFNSGITGWTSFDSGTGGGGAAWDGVGAMLCTGGASGNGGGYQDVPLVVGKTYWITGTRSNSNVTLILYPTTSMAGGVVPTISGSTYGMVFTATAALQRVYAYCVNGATGTIDNVSIQQVEADRSYKNQPLTIYGTLAKTLVGGLAMYSGWSASNYLQQAYSADVDFAAAWRISCWLNIPTTGYYGPQNLKPYSQSDTGFFGAGTTPPTVTPSVTWQGQSSTQITFDQTMTSLGYSGCRAGETGTGHSAPVTSGVPTQSGIKLSLSRALTGSEEIDVYFTGSYGSTVFKITAANCAQYVNAWSLVNVGTATAQAVATGAIYPVVYLNGAATSSVNVYVCQSQVNVGTTLQPYIATTTSAYNGIACAFDRSTATGPYIRAGVDGNGYLAVEAYDGTTTRRTTSATAYNTGIQTKASFEYTTDGALVVGGNGTAVGGSTGNPLLTLSNAAAVLTVGNARTLDAAFPGSIGLLKVGATVPTSAQKAFMFLQENAMWQSGAVCTLPDNGAVAGVDYDSLTDRVKVVSSANESSWQGLVCVGSTAASVGSFSQVSHRSGVKLLAHGSPVPGVDVTIPPQSLMTELFNRWQGAAKLARLEETFDWVGGFTANTTGTTNPLTSVSPAVNTWAGSILPTTAGYIGAQITGTGIPAGTTIGSVESSNTVIRMTANATANGTGVAIAFTDFILPVGYEAKSVLVNGVFKQEGATKDWTRLYDGFRETIRFAVAPGSTAWVQIKARRTK